MNVCPAHRNIITYYTPMVLQDTNGLLPDYLDIIIDLFAESCPSTDKRMITSINRHQYKQGQFEHFLLSFEANN